MTPLVSIIIPTANRPLFLPRAVESALASIKPGKVEVIVVPNGPDESWKESLKPFLGNRAVRIIPIPEANANIARNRGMDDATGEFIRFLDDDDYLIPEGAVKQHALIQSSDADVVSGHVQLVNEHGKCFRIWPQPDTNDFTAAVLGPWCNCHPTAHVFRRSSLHNVKWNPYAPKSQDLEFIYDLCASKEIRWLKINDSVGIWYHHWSKRISSVKSISYNEAKKIIVPMLIRTYNCLCKTNRINMERQNAVAANLWTLIHSAFFLESGYWTKIAHQAQAIDASARPMPSLYYFPVLRNINPLTIQWIMFPKRWITYQLRMISNKFKFRQLW